MNARFRAVVAELYPDLDRIFRSWGGPGDTQDELVEQSAPDPHERRRNQAALSALERDAVEAIDRFVKAQLAVSQAKMLNPAKEHRALVKLSIARQSATVIPLVDAFFLGVHLGALGFAKVPQGSREVAPPREHQPVKE